MFKFILKRIGYGILVLVGVVFLVFFLFNSLPVDPARLAAGQRTDGPTLQQIRHDLGLDQPYFTRLGLYFNDLSPISIHGTKDAKSVWYLDSTKYSYTKMLNIRNQSLVIKKPYLRKSFQNGRQVSAMIAERFPNTAMLAMTAMILAIAIGIILGCLSAVYQSTWFDNLATFLSTIGISIPAYLSAMILIVLLAKELGHITHLNNIGSFIEYDDLGNKFYSWKNLIIPALALGLRPIAIVTQLTRSSMLDVLSQDYIRTARAKGLSFVKVIFKHALKNALNPVVTSISGWFAALLTGTFFIEATCNYVGLGLMTVTHLLLFDLPVIMAMVLFSAVIFVVINIFVDILYGLLDPRIRVKG